MLIYNRHLVALVSLSILLVRNAIAQDSIDRAKIAEVQAGCSSAIASYERIARRLEEEAILDVATSGKLNENKQNANRQIKLITHSLDDNILIKTIRSNGTGKDTIQIQVRNPLYSFSLTQRHIDSPYVLVEYTRGDGTQPSKSIEAGLVSACYQDMRHLLEAIKPGSEFRLTGLTAEGSIIKGAYENTVDIGKVTSARKQTLWIETSGIWRIMKREIQAAGQTVQTVVHYGPTIEGLPFPNRFVEETVRPNGQVSKIETSISLQLTCKTPADFRLSAFGLPDPIDLPQQDPSRRYLWFILVAVIFGALAIVFWRSGRPKSIESK